MRTDGTLECWDLAGAGEVVPPWGTFLSIDGGFDHWCGLRTDNTVECWGSYVRTPADVRWG